MLIYTLFIHHPIAEVVNEVEQSDGNVETEGCCISSSGCGKGCWIGETSKLLVLSEVFFLDSLS